MHLQINLNIRATYADADELSKEIAKVIDRTEKELNERNIPHCSEYIVNGIIPAYAGQTLKDPLK
mgnify:CR=1 FL=1